MRDRSSRGVVIAAAAVGTLAGAAVAWQVNVRPGPTMAAAGPSVLGVAVLEPAMRTLGPALLAGSLGGRAFDHLPFVGPAGLTRAGEVAARWLTEARFHGWPDLTEAGERAAKAIRGLPRRVVLRTAAPRPQELRDRWLTGGARAVREHITASARGQDSPDLGGHAEQKRRAGLDRDMADALAQLVTGMATQPRQRTSLTRAKRSSQDREVVSPEVLWEDGRAPRANANAVEAVREIASQGAAALDAWLTARQPHYPQYARLVAAARDLDAVCSRGAWEPVPVPGPRKTKLKKRKLSDGKIRKRTELVPWSPPASRTIRAVQRRLTREGFFEGSPSGRWDAATETGIRAYQAARNVHDSGVFDTATAEALNVPCAARVAQVVLNVERWRYSAIANRATYLFVNIPGFELSYLREGVPRRRQRAVVGRTRSYRDRETRRRVYPQATPILTDAVTMVVVNPAREGAARLVRHELGPRETYDPGLVGRDREQVRVIAEDDPTRLARARWSGPQGDVKLVTTRRDDIHLHDSPDKWAFRRNARAYTRGSVRVDDAMEVAAALLSDDAAVGGRSVTTKEVLGLTTDRDKRHRYALNAPVTLIFEYYTASVDDDGLLRLHPDLYGYDAAYFGAQVSSTAP